MNQVMKPWHYVAAGRATSLLMTEAERMEAKRLEKLQAHSFSHRTAGTHEIPKQTVGILQQLETEHGHS